MIRASWLDHLHAPPGFLLMIRDKMLSEKAGLVLPYGIQNYTRSGSGTVLHSTVGHLVPGDRVTIIEGAGRRFVVGGWTLGETEFEVVRIRPSEILAKCGHEDIENFGEHYLRLYEGKGDLMDDGDPRFDEGDRDGLR